MGFTPSFPPIKLNGNGEVVLQVLHALLDRVFQKQGFRFRPPIHPVETQDAIAEDGTSVGIK